MRSLLRRFAPALALSLALVLLWNGHALADGVGKIFAIINQVFGARVNVSAPTANQTLVFDGNGNLTNATAPAGPTTSNFATVLANTPNAGHTGTNNILVDNGQGIGFRAVSPGTDQIKWGTGGSFVNSPEILGPSDQTLNIQGGSGAAGVAGQFCALSGGNGNGISPVLGNGANVSLAGGGSGGQGGAASMSGGTAQGTNVVSNGLTLFSGEGTGTATPAQIVFSAAYITAASTTIQNTETVASIQNNTKNLSGSTALFTVNPTWIDSGSASTTAARTLAITSTYNYTAGTGSTLDLLVNRTETSLPSGRNDFLSLQVASVPKHVVTNSGSTLLQSAAVINWSSTSDATGAADIGMSRTAAGVVLFTNGSTGPGSLFASSIRMAAAGGYGVANSLTDPTAAPAGALWMRNSSAALTAGLWHVIDGTGTVYYDDFGSGVGLRTRSDYAIGWASGTDSSGSFDTALSRDSAGVVDFGTGAQGSKAGSWNATNGTLTGTLTNAAGSAAAPTVVFTGATTSGLYSPGANQLGLATNGVKAITIDASQTITTAANGALAQNFTTGGLILPICSTGAPSGAAPNANIVVGGDNHLWVRLNGAWSQLDAQTSATPTLGAVANAGNQVNSVSASKNITWTTGGTFAAGSTSQIYGNTDGTLFVSAGTPASAGNGQALTLSAGLANGAANAGGPINFNSAKSGSGTTAKTLVQLTAAGSLQWQTGLGISNEIVGPTDNHFFIQAGNIPTFSGNHLFLSGGASGPSGTSGGSAYLSAGPANGSVSNENSGNVILQAYQATGNGSSAIYMQTGFIAGSGTTIQNTTYDRLLITSQTKALSTTTATPTIFCLLSNSVTDSGVGCEVLGTIELIDGAHHVGVVTFEGVVGAVNQNGTPVVSTTLLSSAINNGGTYTSLTTTFTASVSGTNIQLTVTPSWSAGTPTTVRMTYQCRANGQGTLTPQ